MAYLDGCYGYYTDCEECSGCCVMNQCEDKTKERSTHEY